MTIGEKIILYRETLGMSQTKLAQKARITGPCLSNYENDKRKPELEAFMRLCKAIGITMDKFMDDVVVDSEIEKEEIFTEEQMDFISNKILTMLQSADDGIKIYIKRELNKLQEGLEERIKKLERMMEK